MCRPPSGRGTQTPTETVLAARRVPGQPLTSGLGRSSDSYPAGPGPSAQCPNRATAVQGCSLSLVETPDGSCAHVQDNHSEVLFLSLSFASLCWKSCLLS
eukprot:748946-Hanusia_phi.AAC.1